MQNAPDATNAPGVRPASLSIVDPALAARVAAPAHDSVTRAERTALAGADALSYLNVLRTPEDDDTDLHTTLGTNRAALQRLLRANVFHAGATPRFAWYRLGAGGHEQTALVAEVALDDYDRGHIAPHEHTRADLEERLAAHLETLGASANPVSLAHPADARLQAIRTRATAGPPAVRFTSHDGVEHTIWTTEDPGPIAEIEAAAHALPRLYITDGHHRFAAAARVAAARRAAGGGRPDAPDQWLLAALFPADELRILPFHRAVQRPREASARDLLARLGDHVTVRALSRPQTPERAHHFVAYLDGRWYELSVRDTGDGPLDTLDVVVLQRHVLAPAFGITQPRIDPRLHYLAGGSDAVRAYCDHEHAIGFVVRATTMDQLMAVADAGLVMPPKSTRFDPKPRAGLFLHLIG